MKYNKNKTDKVTTLVYKSIKRDLDYLLHLAANPAVIDLSGYVPYTGATTDINLGGHDLIIGGFKFNNDQSHNILYFTDSVANLLFSFDLGRITSPSLTSERIIAGGNRSLITKEYLEANSGDITGLVPYTGATADIDLGEHSITLGKDVIDADKTYTEYLKDSVMGDVFRIIKSAIPLDPFIGGTAAGIGALGNASDIGYIQSNAFGWGALENNTGSTCSAFGNFTMYNNSGDSSNGFGSNSLRDNQGTNSNGFGNFNLRYVAATSSNLTAIGHNSSVGTIGTPLDFVNSTSIGANSNITKSNQVVLGDANVTEAKTAGTYVSGGYTVATLPTGVTGARAYVTDATATTFYSIVAGGGANVVPVFYNGTNWVIA